MKSLHSYGDIVTTTEFKRTVVEFVMNSPNDGYYYSLFGDPEGILRNENELGFYFSGAWPDSANAYQFSIYDFRVEHVGGRYYIEAVLETPRGRAALFEILKLNAAWSIDRLDSHLMQHVNLAHLCYLLDKPDRDGGVGIITALWTAFEKLLKNDHFCKNLFRDPEKLYTKKT